MTKSTKSTVLDNLLSEAADRLVSSAESPKEKLEKHPRMSAVSIEELAKLYDLKIEDKPLHEQAHPESVALFNAHDKVNGLFENDSERQAIMIKMVNRIPSGIHSHRKLAEKNLMLSMIRIANDLDNQQQDRLRALTDSCIVNLTDKIEKKANLHKEAIPAALPYVAIVGIIGGIWLQQHLAFANEGFQTNHEKLIAEIDDFSKASSSWSIGVDYKPEFLALMNDFKQKLNTFYSTYAKNVGKINEIEKPKTAQELMQEVKQNPDTKSYLQAQKEMEAAVENMLPYIAAIEKNFKSETYKARQIEGKGLLSSLVDKTQVLHGGKGLISDDFDDVNRAIPPYRESLKELLKIIREGKNLKQNALSQLQSASTEMPQETEPQPPTAGKGISDLDEKLKELSKHLPQELK